MPYMPAYRAIKIQKFKMNISSDGADELLILYLEKFKLQNNNAFVGYEKAENNHMVCCFICPAFTNEALEYVKPVISLDACHLKRYKRGTLC
jgi:hypothetical protein